MDDFNPLLCSAGVDKFLNVQKPRNSSKSQKDIMKQVLYSGRKYFRPNCKKFLLWRLGSGNLSTPDVDYYKITETGNSAFAVGDHIQIIKSVCHPNSLVWTFSNRCDKESLRSLSTLLSLHLLIPGKLADYRSLLKSIFVTIRGHYVTRFPVLK